MTVLLASELTDADLALLTRPEAPALRLGGLRLLARAAGVPAARPTAANAPGVVVPIARSARAPRGWPGISPDRPGSLRAG
jgi:hypothetical protein